MNSLNERELKSVGGGCSFVQLSPEELADPTIASIFEQIQQFAAGCRI